VAETACFEAQSWPSKDSDPPSVPLIHTRRSERRLWFRRIFCEKFAVAGRLLRRTDEESLNNPSVFLSGFARPARYNRRDRPMVAVRAESAIVVETEGSAMLAQWRFTFPWLAEELATCNTRVARSGRTCNGGGVPQGARVGCKFERNLQQGCCRLAAVKTAKGKAASEPTDDVARLCRAQAESLCCEPFFRYLS
jgi:hypothetical protein